MKVQITVTIEESVMERLQRFKEKYYSNLSRSATIEIVLDRALAKPKILTGTEPESDLSIVKE